MHLDAHVDKTEALRYLGYAGQVVDDQLMSRFDRARSICEELNASGMAKSFPIASFICDDQGVECGVQLKNTPLVLRGYSTAEHLNGAREAVLLAVTLGLQSENMLRREAAQSTVDGVLVDACASAMTEDAADVLCAIIQTRAEERGYRAAGRFSPGFGDFPLEVQQAFLDAIGAAKALGISVTQGNLLVPAKSITAVVGLYDPEHTIKDEYASASTVTDRSDFANICEKNAEGEPTYSQDCETCDLKSTCQLHAQGRTCYAR